MLMQWVNSTFEIRRSFAFLSFADNLDFFCFEGWLFYSEPTVMAHFTALLKVAVLKLKHNFSCQLNDPCVLIWKWGKKNHFIYENNEHAIPCIPILNAYNILCFNLIKFLKRFQIKMMEWLKHQIKTLN